MARPTKNSCDYFPHDKDMRHHKKIKSIRSKFKSAGYAIWVMTLEYLTGNDGNEFEYSDLEFELMSGDFDEPSELIKSVIDYAIKLELLFVENNFVYSESLNERLAPVYEKRGKAKELSKKQKRVNGKYVSDTNNTEATVITVTETTEQPTVTVTEMPQSKVNKTKVKKTKENKKEVPPEVLQLRGECKQSFIEYYKQIKNEDFYWVTKDAVALISLINKIVFKIKEKQGISDIPNKDILSAFNLIIKNVQDKWVLDNYSLPNINSKFNEIFIQIKNANNGISNNKPTGKESIYRS